MSNRLINATVKLNFDNTIIVQLVRPRWVASAEYRSHGIAGRIP
jgi:hypothetical protein